MLVEAWLQRAARTRPQHTALTTSAGDESYVQLHKAAHAGAAELFARGARTGTRVAIVLPAGVDFAHALHACMLLGAVAVPVDVRLSAVERERIVAGAVTVVEEPLARTVLAGTDLVPADDDLQRALTRGHELDATAVVVHTSGTTSNPRAIELTYGNLLWSALGSAVALGRDPDERWLCALPPSHVGGLSILVRSVIYGTTAVLHERFETERALACLQEGEATLVSLVATTLDRLLDAGLLRPPTLRCALTGGGPVPPALVTRAHEMGVPVSLTYGLTEACSQVTTTPVAMLGAAAGGSAALVGPPLFCTRVSLADDGEILVRGPTVAATSFADDGWLHTGDLGDLDDRGNLRVVGRKADTIVSGGENVAPAEVEAVLEAHAGVLEAAVLGRPDPRWGEAVTAIVVPRDGAEPPTAELRQHCARMLAPFKVPKEIVIVRERLPRTPSGKLLRRALNVVPTTSADGREERP